MSRYIDADALKLDIDMSQGARITDFALSVIRAVQNAPTADVAPRAEVAREIFEEIEREITDALKSNYKVLPQIELSEALWNNVNGKINALRGIEYFMEELKKKYTEEK
jgi:hypothetical protein